MRGFALLLAIGCSQKTDLLPRSNLDGSAGCSGPRSIGGECAGAAAAARLRYALCSCSALVVEHGLFTDSSDMRLPLTAAVGTDEHVQIAGFAQVNGALTAAGPNGALFGRSADVAGTLHSGGALISNQLLTIEGDAFVNGDLLGRIDVAGVLHVPRGARVPSSVAAEGGVVNEPISVAPPCNCNAAPDLIGDLANHEKQNDNGSIQLSPDVLDGGAGVLDLPCGEFYLSRIHMPPMAGLELRVHGFAALYVGGEVVLGAGLRVTLDPGAELDLVAGGDFTVPDGVVGAPDAERVRLWLDGQTLRLGRFVVLSASVYAPNAVVFATDGDLRVAGALLAAGLSVQGDVGVHYDADILNAGASCGVMPQAPVE